MSPGASALPKPSSSAWAWVRQRRWQTRRHGLWFIGLAVWIIAGLGALAWYKRGVDNRVRIGEQVAALIDESLDELILREDVRPHDQYNAVYRPEGVVAASDAFLPSPLAQPPPDPRIGAYFQFDRPDKARILDEGKRPDVAHAVRTVLLSGAIDSVRLSATEPRSADVDGGDGSDRGKAIQAVSKQENDIYEQLKTVEQDAEKRAMLAYEEKLPRYNRKTVDTGPAKGSSGANASNATPQAPRKVDKKRGDEPLPATPAAGSDVDYTSMSLERIDNILVMHRTVSLGAGRVVQGLLFDNSGIDRWVRELMDRRIAADDLPTLESGDACRTDAKLTLPLLVPLDDRCLRFPGSSDGVPVLFLLLLASLVTIALWLVERAAARAELLGRQKSAFVSSVSHELRTPLTTLRMHAELLRDGLVAPERRARFHDDLVNESTRLSALVDNVLEVARLEEGRRVLRVNDIDMGQLITTTVEEQRRFIESKNFAIEVVITPNDDSWDALRGQLDRTAIEQVVVNLLGNAVKYGQPQDGQPATIRVSVSNTTTELVVHVADDGRGIPVAERERVFERFHRVWHGDLSHVAGTGLGLYLVRQLAVAHGGSARVVDTGRGCVIEVRLPKTATSTVGAHHDPLGWDATTG